VNRCPKCARSWPTEQVRHYVCPHVLVTPKPNMKPGVGDHTPERVPEHAQ
jgi:hypothetical protein